MPSQIRRSRKIGQASKAGRASKKQLSTNLTVRLTHPERVIYPEQGITKRDLANYYATVAEWMLPHVSDRPLAMVRCPEGMSGACFFQKHPPPGMSADVGRIEIREKNETGTYVVVHDLKGLLTLIQFGVLEIHAWGARSDDIERPDRVVFDLDPDPAVPWNRVVQSARWIRELLQQRKLKSFVKTTGGKGLHIVAPIARKYTWAEVKQFAKEVAEVLVSAAPDQYIATMSKAARRGKIFIDYLRNERGATAVVAYSSRAKAGAPVSTPIAWEELGRVKSPQQFRVQNLPKRLKNLRSDPWDELPKLRQAIASPRKKVLSKR